MLASLLTLPQHRQQHRRGLPLACAAVGDDVRKAKGSESALREAAGFFVESFWVAGTTSEACELSGRERSQLATQQADDMDKRYGELVGSRRLKSSLFVARDVDGYLKGCVGVEAALVDVIDRRVLTRAQGEALFASEFDEMSAIERSQYRKMDVVQLTEELLPEYRLFGLLANLAVAPSTRRSGLARRLCARCEEEVDSWGLPAILLQVEEANGAARGLYEAVGYDEIFRDEAAAALRVRPDSDELLQSVPSTLITMAKAL